MVEDINISDKKEESLNGEKMVNTMISLNNTVNSIIREIDFSGIIKTVTALSSTISKMLSSDYMTSIKETFAKLANAIEEAHDNPYSYLNFYDYQNSLDEFHWAWPFDISPEELKQLIEQANDEIEFDRLIASYFTKERLQNMFYIIENGLPRRHTVIFGQIKKAFYNRQYALMNTATVAIIENILGIVLKDKGCTKRKGILKPIIKYYADNYMFHDLSFLFELQMLSNNIDLIFSDYRFGSKVFIESNKKVRRHLSAHGYMFSNRRIDSIMLLNTLAAILINIDYITPFEKTVEKSKNKKLFIICTKDYVIRNRIQKITGIESLEN
jgi:hypothetical protein